MYVGGGPSCRSATTDASFLDAFCWHFSDVSQLCRGFSVTVTGAITTRINCKWWQKNDAIPAEVDGQFSGWKERRICGTTVSQWIWRRHNFHACTFLFFLFSHALRDPSGQLGSLEGLHEWCCCTRFFQLVAKCLTLAERPSAIPRWDTSFQRGFYLSVSGCTTWRRGPHRLVKCPEESALFLHTCSLLKGITWKLKLPCSLRILTLKNVLAATHSYEWSRIRCRKMTAVLLHLMHLEDST